MQNQDYVLYGQQNHAQIQVPSFMTTAQSFRNKKLTTGRTNTSLTPAMSQTNLVSTIDDKICDKSVPLNLKSYHKFHSESSETNSFKPKLYIQPKKLINFIEFCNTKVLDKELNKRKQVICVKLETESQQHIQYIPQKNARTVRINRSNNFTLPQMKNNEQKEQQIESLLNKINLNKIDTQIQKSIQMSPPQSQPNYQNYITKQPIRRYDMIFNVKQLIRLQDKRQKELQQQQQNDPEFQIEIIKRQNQISVLMANTKKIEQLKRASGGILEHINEQDKQAEKICQDFQNTLQFH